MMYKADQFSLWKELTDDQRSKITKLIDDLTYKIGTENPLEHCGGGTVGDYYRIQFEYFVLNLLDELENGK